MAVLRAVAALTIVVSASVPDATAPNLRLHRDDTVRGSFGKHAYSASFCALFMFCVPGCDDHNLTNQSYYRLLHKRPFARQNFKTGVTCLVDTQSVASSAGWLNPSFITCCVLPIMQFVGACDCLFRRWLCDCRRDWACGLQSLRGNQTDPADWMGNRHLSQVLFPSSLFPHRLGAT